MFPESKCVRKCFLPLLDSDGLLKPALMIQLEQLLDDYALSIWKAAWMMMAEGYENNEDGIQAFCAAHPQYQMVVRAQAACPENI